MARLASATTNTPRGRRVLGAADSRANSKTMSVARGDLESVSGSDQENLQPRVTKGKQPMRDVAQPPTPDSMNDGTGQRPTKRRRTGDEVTAPHLEDMDSEGDDQGNDQGDNLQEDGEESHADDAGVAQAGLQQRAGHGQSHKTVHLYDPNQDEGERRDIKRKSRALERELLENRDEYLRVGDGRLRHTIERANDIFNNVKQTSDATTDSRLMVGVSDLAHRKSTQLSLHDSATGIDVDEFVSKCIAFMRPTGRSRNAISSSTQGRSQAHTTDVDEDDNDEVDILDWSHLGRQACIPNNLRPPVPSFLLGPLSVQKRTRAPTQRRARNRADDIARVETRPQAIEREDLSSSENHTVRHICSKIKTRLQQHCASAVAHVEAELSPDASETEIAAAMRATRITATGGPSLFDFVVHPTSFAQTVENLFYVSFLIKEGEVGVEMDDDGLPTLVPNAETGADARARKSKRRQAVFGLDFETWRSLVDAFDIKEGLIPSRDEDGAGTVIGARGWYS